jgi:preprotein translocase subunit SecD
VTAGDEHGSKYVLLSHRTGEVMLSGSARPRPWHLKRVYATTDAEGRPAIGIELDEAAAKRMGELTKRNPGRCLAILYHDKVFAFHQIDKPLTDTLVIRGDKIDKALAAQIIRSLTECMIAPDTDEKPKG